MINLLCSGSTLITFFSSIATSKSITLITSNGINEQSGKAGNLIPAGTMGILFIIIPIAVIIGVLLTPQVRKRIVLFIKALIEIISNIGVSSNSTGDKGLDILIRLAGYAYDRIQDIFYSTMYPWQRNFGYCHLYDEGMAPMGMIIDCEPIYFEYDGKRWLVELWKGQYDLTMGAEIGVYTTKKYSYDILPEKLFYECASDADRLKMSCTLERRNGDVLFRRDAKHWWLTGFILGEFCQPWDVILYANITLKNREMLHAFLRGLAKAGYYGRQVNVNGNTVSLKFDKPHSPQPSTRTPETDRIIQEKNRIMCELYQKITKPYKTIPEKVKAVQEQAPEVYERLFSIGKTRELFKIYDKAKDSMDKDD